MYNTVQYPRNYTRSESQTLLQQCNTRRSIPYPTGTKEQMDAVLNPHENINKTIDSNKKTKKGGKAAERDRDDGRRKRKISSSDESVLLDQYVSEKKRITIASNGY